MVDPPLRVGNMGAHFVPITFCRRGRDERAKAAGSQGCRPCDLPITAGKQGQVQVGNGCAITNGRFCLLGLLGRDKTCAALGRLQPASSPLLLAGEAGEIVDLLMSTGVRDNLSHNAMMPSNDFQATGMSQVESGMRQVVGLRVWPLQSLRRARRPRH